MNNSHAGGGIALAPAPPLTSGNIGYPEVRASQLRRFLQSMGGSYPCFGLYLASRIDLLPAEYCREFALIPDEGAPLPAVAVQELLEGEFGGRLAVTFPQLDLTPIRSTLITQYHSAELANGIPVVIAILRPEFQPLKNEGISQPVDNQLLREQCRELVAGNALSDFKAALARKIDFTYQAEKLELMARDTASFESLEIPRIYREFSSAHALTLARSPGMNLNQILQSDRFTAEKLATLVCKVWLQQALFGRCFPVDPQYRHVTISDTNRIIFAPCDYLPLPRRSQENLWSYLLATTTDDPDRAARFLLKEMSQKEPARVDHESFRSSFRQSAYFGALEPVLGTDTNAFPQLVFQHWKTAMTHGYTPEEPLLAFFRGLFSVARIARDIFPTGDPLRYALEEIRTARIVEQMRDFVDVRFLSQNFDKFLVAAAHLPRALDEALTRASKPEDGGSPNDQAGSGQHESRHHTPTLLAFSFLVATVFVSQSAAMPPWTSKLALLSLMLIGLLILRGLRK